MTTPLFVVLALIGMPLFIVLGAAALVASHDAQLAPALLMVEFSRLAESPNLVAIPLFVLAGATLGLLGGVVVYSAHEHCPEVYPCLRVEVQVRGVGGRHGCRASPLDCPPLPGPVLAAVPQGRLGGPTESAPGGNP